MAVPRPDSAHVPQPLRIMPVGDSFTEGVGSSDGNGYRLPLLRLLKGWDKDVAEIDNENDDEVRFVGSRRSGSMKNNAHEGHVNTTIRDVTAAFRESLRERTPDVVLVHVGLDELNMKNSPDSYETAARQVGELMDIVFLTLPETVVLVAWQVQSGNSAIRKTVKKFDDKVFRQWIYAQEGGCRVIMAMMNPVKKRSRDFADGLHPNDKGYARMAHGWYNGLKRASQNGWISIVDRPQEQQAQAVDKAPTCLCL